MRHETERKGERKKKITHGISWMHIRKSAVGRKKKKVCFKFWEADFYYCIVKRTSSVDFRNAAHMLKVVKVLLLQVELEPR